jgi:hypothetical protein
MADGTGKVILLGGAAFAVYWFYLRPSTTGTSTSSAGGAGPILPAPSTQPSLDSLFNAMVAAAANDPDVVKGTAGPDTWNVYLLKVYPAIGTPPDPVPIFGGRSAMTATVYWAGMAPWLRTNKGLSGIGRYGLGAVGSLRYGGLRRG